MRLTEEDFKNFTHGFFEDAATGPGVRPKQLERLAGEFARMVYGPLNLGRSEDGVPWAPLRKALVAAQNRVEAGTVKRTMLDVRQVADALNRLDAAAELVLALYDGDPLLTAYGKGYDRALERIADALGIGTSGNARRETLEQYTRDGQALGTFYRADEASNDAAPRREP